MTSAPTVRDQALSLFTFLREVVALRSKTVRTVDHDDYELVKWIADIPQQSECYCVAWETAESAAKRSETWVEVQKPRAKPHPPVPPALKPWLDAVEVADSSNDYPDLRQEALVEEDPASKAGGAFDGARYVDLEQMPQILEQWEDYVEKVWQPWAAEDRHRRTVQELYDDLFSVHQRLETLAEDYELLVGFGLISWKTPSGHIVKRHLLTTRCDLSFDAARARFSVGPSPEGSLFNLEQDMLEIEDQPRPSDVEEVLEELELVAEGFWHDGSLHEVIRRWVHSASSAGSYDKTAGHPALSSEDLVVAWAPAIIMRKRTDRPILDLYDRILRYIGDGGEIPPGVEALVSMDERSVSDEAPLVTEQLEADDRIYFPLESNAEQVRIVTRLAHSGGLLVQGPPGTGKSHTIANLITHLLALGQRVLVTSQTPRALKVLKQKMPQQVTDLCVMLIGDDREALNDVERSVQAITDRYNTWDPEENARTVARLETAWDEASRVEADVRRRLVALREGEVEPCVAVAGGYHGTMQQIAERLDDERERYGWLKVGDDVGPSSDAPLTSTEARRLLALLRSVESPNDDDTESVVPSLDRIPESLAFQTLVMAEARARDGASAALSGGIDAARVAGIAQSSEAALEAAQSALGRFRQAVRTCLSHGEGWCSTAVEDVLTGRAGKWAELESMTRAVVTWVDELPSSVLSATITGAEGLDLGTVRGDATTLVGHLQAGGGLGNRLVRPKPAKQAWYIVESMRVDGQSPNELDRLTVLVQWCELRLRLSRLDESWAPFTTTPQGAEQLRTATYRDLLRILSQVVTLGEAVEESRRAVSSIDGLGEPAWHSDDSVARALELLAAAQAERGARESRRPLDSLVGDIASFLEAASPHPLGVEFLRAIETRSVNEYARVRTAIAAVARERADVNERDAMWSRLRAAAPSTAEDLVSGFSDPVWDQRMADFASAWSWAMAKAWLAQSMEPGALEALLADWDRAHREIRALLTSLAEAKAWASCFQELTERERKHLMAWMQATRRIGKGTGKNAARHRREARAHMRECRSAIPGWVMPIYRVAESITPGRDQFDVVIVDEASQSGIDALFLQFIGKKIVIVGDNKQIAPEYIGTKMQAVQELRQRHIPDLPISSEFTVESSLFDQAAIHYRSSIRLKEHFRCMPEIIQFSNLLCYAHDPLIPLRQYGSERLEPIKCVFVEDGYQEGTASRAINRPEAEAIVRAIVECCRDPQYTGRTMGLISLLGGAQAKLIERLLMRELGPEAMEERRLVCGDAYSFQGDERHVMFLSMVSAASAGHRIGPLVTAKDERRFNVAASRAKDQMWLFHSVTPHDLSLNCMRTKLLKYCMNPHVDPILAHGEISVQDLRLLASEPRRADREPPAPFDSWFEVDVFLRIADRGFRVAPQYEVAGYRIDLVVEGGRSRLAVECDGDTWHGREQFEADMARQRQLERAGWAFWRVRGSEFYRDPDAALRGLWRELERHGVRSLTGSMEEGDSEDDAATDAGTLAVVIPEASAKAGDDVLRDDEASSISVDSTGPSPVTSTHGEISAAGPSDNQISRQPDVAMPIEWLRHPAVGFLPADTVPLVRPYILADVESVLDGVLLADVPTRTLARYLVQVVDVESPVHIIEAARRVARSAGIRRVGHVIEAAFRRAASDAESDGSLIVEGDFLWSCEQTDAPVRSRADLPPISRMVDLISDEELEWALFHVLATQGPIANDGISQRVMRALGFERTSREAAVRVQEAVRRGLQAGALTVVDARVVLHGHSELAKNMGRADAMDRCLGSRTLRTATPSVRYTLAEPTIDFGDHEFHELPTDYLAAALQEVVQTEGPIHVSEAARRLANSCGLERAGIRIQTAVFAACRQLEQERLVLRRGDFLWAPEGELRVRDRSDAPASLRDIKLIAPEEIVLAAQTLGGTASNVDEELITNTSRLLGFRRTGKDVYGVIRSILSASLSKGH